MACGRDIWSGWQRGKIRGVALVTVEGLEGLRTTPVRKVSRSAERVAKGVEIGIIDDDIILRFVAHLGLR